MRQTAVRSIMISLVVACSTTFTGLAAAADDVDTLKVGVQPDGSIVVPFQTGLVRHPVKLTRLTRLLSVS